MGLSGAPQTLDLARHEPTLHYQHSYITAVKYFRALTTGARIIKL
jgi:hypothetical protein